MRSILRRVGIATLTLVVVGAVGLIVMLKVMGVPLMAMRNSPPQGIEARALAVGAAVAPFELPTATGGTFSLAKALEGGRAVLIFYRGAW